MKIERLSAYSVLKDCRIAHGLLELEEDEARWRVHWVGAIALIRAVGHVLHNVDTETFPQIRSHVSEAFKAWKSDASEHQIFRDFINEERNNVLKEYRSSAHPSGVVPIVLERLPFAYTEDQQGKVVDFELLADNLFRPRVEGFMAGEDCRDIYLDAINWWRRELEKVAAKIS